MNASSVALSVIGTLAVAGYVCYTEFPFWERWTKKDEAKSNKPKLVKRTKKKKTKKKTKKASASSQKPDKKPKAEKVYRTGDAIYWVDQDCDCQQGSAILLETVENTSDSTILTFLNARQAAISSYPPGHEHQQYILEWRYDSKGNRPRLNITESRDVPTYPQKGTPLNFQLVFPRVSDNAPKFQLTGKASSKLDYFQYSSIEFENKMDPEEAENYDNYRRCGFNGISNIATDQEKMFSAHKHPGGGGYRWTTSPELEISGSTRKDKVVVAGVSEGKGEVCLNARVDGASCKYCQPVKVTGESNEVEADFKMSKCRGLPSVEPHWQFTVTEPKRGTAYRWEVTNGKIRRVSGKKPTLIFTPNLRPGKFEITLNTISKKGKSKTTREYHSVYSCVENF